MFTVKVNGQPVGTFSSKVAAELRAQWHRDTQWSATVEVL